MRQSRPGREVPPPSSSEERVCGVHPVMALLTQHAQRVLRVYVLADTGGGPVARLNEIVQLCGKHKIEIRKITARALGGMSPHPAHQGVVAVTAEFGYFSLDYLQKFSKEGEDSLVVALDQVQDPHNLGAIARSALALGAQAILICERRSAQVTASAQKAAAGALQHLPVIRVTNMAQSLKKLREQGFWVLGTAADASRPLTETDWKGPTVLVLGGEANGMRPLVATHCDEVLSIPLASASESLNVSVAAGICLWQAFCVRQARLFRPS